MAVYDGFFDAALDEATGKYDREYGAAHFTGYFAQLAGSGVCVYQNPDSMKVRMEGGSAVVSPGYLFIQGYWLRNTEDYTVEIPSSGMFAVAAHLNLGRRMIEISPQSVAQAYPDSLVLALVSAEAGTAEDTRYNTDLCGVVDAAGSLAGKVEYALRYIDTEIEGRLEAAQQAIDEKAAQIDRKIAEVQAVAARIIPPPVGSIQFSASQDVGPEWLHCDGRFVSESEYPALVAALGKLSPGVEDFRELLHAEDAEFMSNIVVSDGTAWVYLLNRQKLVGIQAGSAQTVTYNVSVSGAGSLRKLANVPAVLSICGGSLYLAQWGGTAANALLLECAQWDGKTSSITVQALDVPAKISAVPGVRMLDRFVPKVVDIYGTKYLAFGLTAAAVSSSNTEYASRIHYLSWTAGAFADAATGSFNANQYRRQNGGSMTETGYFKSIMPAETLYAFNPKNGNDLLFSRGSYDSYVHPTTVNGESCNAAAEIDTAIRSFHQNIYGDYEQISTDSQETQGFQTEAELYASAAYKKFRAADDVAKNVLPVGAGGEVLLRAEITGGKLQYDIAKYSPRTALSIHTAEVRLPARAKLFPDSVAYAELKGMWFVFVGAGLLFTRTLSSGAWGYLDTTDVLGTVALSGSLEYELDTNSLYLAGVDTLGVPRAARLKLPEPYSYANDGAFLPALASDGVPAYIKAYEPEGGGG